MHRGRLALCFLGASVAGCEWVAGIDDLRVAPDADDVTEHEGGGDGTVEGSSGDERQEGIEAADEEPVIDATTDSKLESGADSAALPDSAEPSDSAGALDAGSDAAGPVDARSGNADASDAASPPGQDAGVDASVDSATCACGAQSVCVTGVCAPGRRVFVTNETYSGALGGHAGADSTCQTLAAGAGLGGTWMAWLSDSTSSPSLRFSMPTVGYYLLDGTPIAADWTDLAKNGPVHAIDLTETGASLAAATADGSKTWTATLTTGALGTPSCDDFGSYAVTYEGEVGHCTGTGTVNWTSAYTTETCDVPNHLYCFEQ